MIIIGLTGGTGSGKSTVDSIAREIGINVIDGDIIARQIVQSGERALGQIVDQFGDDILLENGELNRKKLGSIVFADSEKLKILNKITHFYITEKIIRMIEMEKSKCVYNITIIDAAVLIESGIYKVCDYIWVVRSEEQTRLERIMRRDNLSFQDAMNRIKSQMPQEKLLEYADEVIDNNKDLEYVREQLYRIVEKL